MVFQKFIIGLLKICQLILKLIPVGSWKRHERQLFHLRQRKLWIRISWKSVFWCLYSLLIFYNWVASNFLQLIITRFENRDLCTMFDMSTTCGIIMSTWCIYRIQKITISVLLICLWNMRYISFSLSVVEKVRKIKSISY